MTFFIFSHRPDFSDFALFTVIKCHIRPFLHKKNHYFIKEFLHKTIFYSVHPFARIRQHYFSKYWGGPMHGPSPTSNFWGDRPPRSPFLLVMVLPGVLRLRPSSWCHYLNDPHDA